MKTSMKKSFGSLITLNRKGILLLGAMLCLAVFGLVVLRSKAQSPETVGNAGPSVDPKALAGTEITEVPVLPSLVNAPTAPLFAKAIVYDDTNNPGGYQAALQSLGIPYTDFGANFTGFTTALDSANPADTLVIID